MDASSRKLRDSGYLAATQYRNSDRLARRANLHTTYRTAELSTFAFLAGLIDWPEGGEVLDVGVGGGGLWEEVAQLVPAGLHLTLADLSPGMVNEATSRATATGAYAEVSGRTCDAGALPFADDSFDLVVSTYALYHLPDPDRAVAELARVVRPTGTVAVMTNGPGHLAELGAIVRTVFGEDGFRGLNHAFRPAAATASLVERFDQVAWHRYRDTLEVTSLEDVIAYITSSPPGDTADEEQLADLYRMVVARMAAADGIFRVSKHTGAVVATGRSTDPGR